MEKIIVSIPSVNIGGFEAKMDKLVKLSKKLNSGDVTYTKIGEEVKEYHSGDPSREIEKIKYYTFEISGETPTLNGYQLVAILERQKELNLVNHINKNIELPKGLDEQPNYCEHCNSNRKRKYLFLLLEEETGKYIQVGKSCVKDFTGMHSNPENIAQWYSYIEEIGEMEEIDEETFRTARFDTYMNAKDMIAYSSYMTDKYGFVKSWDGTKDNPSTATRTLHYKAYAKEDEVRELGYFDKADEIMNWILNQESTNDYMMNLQTLVKEKEVNTRKIGYLASAYNSYLNYQSKPEKKEKEVRKPSEYVGTIGKRTNYTLVYDRYIAFDTMYGVNYMYFFHDSEDNIYVWKTSNHFDLKAGETVELTGTLKEHNEYRDVKQNVLTRCKIK